MTEIEMGETIDLVSEERFSYDVVEWIDKEGNLEFEVFDLGDGRAFAEQLQGSAQRIMLYEVMDEIGGNKGDIAAYVRDSATRLEV